MAIAMVALIAFGGTYAYFTATAKEAQGEVHTATIQLTSGGTATMSENASNLLPLDTVTASVNLVNKSTRDSYVFVTISNTTLEGATFTLDSVKTGTEEWTLLTGEGVTGTVYYREAAAATDTTNGDTIKVDVAFTFNATADNVEEGTFPAVMNADITVSINARAIQKDNNGTSALDAYKNLGK